MVPSSQKIYVFSSRNCTFFKRYSARYRFVAKNIRRKGLPSSFGASRGIIYIESQSRQRVNAKILSPPLLPPSHPGCFLSSVLCLPFPHLSPPRTPSHLFREKYRFIFDNREESYLLTNTSSLFIIRSYYFSRVMVASITLSGYGELYLWTSTAILPICHLTLSSFSMWRHLPWEKYSYARRVSEHGRWWIKTNNTTPVFPTLCFAKSNFM